MELLGVYGVSEIGSVIRMSYYNRYCNLEVSTMG